MTKEELALSARQADAASTYDYYFSDEELVWVKSVVKPYNCSYGERLSPEDEFLCGVQNVFILNDGGFIPCGYMYKAAFLDKGELKGVRIVKTVAWQLGNCETAPAPVDGAPPASNPGTYIGEPKSGVPYPSGKPLVPSVEPTTK